jgi:hypothetical protein
MKTDPDHDALLSDLFAETDPASRTATALPAMVAAARARRRGRQAKVVVTALAVLGVGLFFGRVSSRLAPVAPSGARAYTLVESRPLPSSAVVSTAPFPSERLVSTVGETRLIRSTSLGYRELDDVSLLALVAARPAVLLRSRSGFEHLVFVNPGDAKGFPAD